MNVKTKKLPASKYELQIELSQDEFHVYWEIAYMRAVESVEMKGFRKGAAPRELVDAALNKEAIFHEAVDKAVRDTLKNVTEDNGYSIIDTPHIEVKSATPLFSKEKLKDDSSGLNFTAEITIFPEVELGDYKKIASDVLKEKKESSVSEEEINEAVRWLINSRATETRVLRAAAKGDAIEVSIKSMVGGEPIPGGSIDNDKFVVGESRFLPGFDDALIGLKEGDVKDFTLTAPADYWQKDLQGKEIAFNVSVKGVFERALPEANDEFAASLGGDFKTMEDVRNNIKEGVRAEKDAKEGERVHAKLLEELVKHSKSDPPEVMIERSIDNLVQEIKQMDPNAKDDKETRDSLRERAKERLMAHLVLHVLAEREHLDPKPEEVEEELRRRNLDHKTYYDYIYGILRHRNIFSFLEEQKS